MGIVYLEKLKGKGEKRGKIWKQTGKYLAAALTAAMCAACIQGSAPLSAYAEEDGGVIEEVKEIVSSMTMDEKISQMIIPAIRKWNGEDVKDLSAFPELAEALRKHQYGGIILFGSNVAGTEQTANLVLDLQENNQKISSVSTHIPYLMPLDEEGGIVTRLTTGTRMTGSMAVGATGESAGENALITGQIIGEELAALGFNTDFAPDIDVNNNAANPVIGTRSFSDDPELTAQLGVSFSRGLSKSDVIATYKHFPGHGDTATDSHIGTPSVEKTYDELLETELIPFAAAIENGAELIMTAHITYPLIDEEKVFGDGETKGFYPATMSRKMITDILRGDLGFDGVVVTDALEMDAIRTAGLVPGETDSVEYRVNIAAEVINAGADILLLPADLTDSSIADLYDAYIAGLEEKVKSGSIDAARIDESVTRILELKARHGILKQDVSAADRDQLIEQAKAVVGSDEHHAQEMEIARQAITVVKNEDVLPVIDKDRQIVFLGRQEDDCLTISFAIDDLIKRGVVSRQPVLDYYYDLAEEGDKMLHFTEELEEAISKADIVIALSKTFSLGNLAESSAQYQGIRRAIDKAHEAGAKFILISDNLPYDAARYQDADAIILAYMGSGLDMDPSARKDGSANMMAYNANVVAAIETVFGENTATGTLPVNIPVILENEDGTLEYSTEWLYERGFGK